MKTFKIELEKKIEDSIYNSFGIENFDEQRFGKFKQSRKEKFKNKIKELIRYRSKQNARPKILKYEDKLEYIWSKLDDRSQSLLIDIIAYRLLGYTKVKLPLNNSTYWNALNKVQFLKKGNDTIDPHFLHFKLERFDLRQIGYDLELYFFGGGIVIDFIIEQYAYKLDDKYILQAEKGDVVLDFGACWGDTALYFAYKVGENGRVFSFEFIPDNIRIFNINLGLNPHLNKRIQLVENPVSEISDQSVYYENNGPGSRISDFSFETQTGSATTISVDDFVERNKISKVDFIKMDIEGAETSALKGAIKTIKKHKPKLAIAIYHGMDDFVNIPRWLMDLNLGYKFHLGHYSIHTEETIIFAN